MRKYILSGTLATIFSILLFGCSDEPKLESRMTSDDFWLYRTVACSINHVGLEVFKNIAEEKNDENIVFSPLSLGYSLSMLANGADLKTQNEFLEICKTPLTFDRDRLTMKFLNDGIEVFIKDLPRTDKYNKVTVANSVWIQNGLKPEADFTKCLDKYFKAPVKNVDFFSTSGKNEIDKWINKNTDGRIESSFEPATGQQLLITNAMLFDGKWDNPFDPKNTAEETFYNYDGTESRVPMLKDHRGVGYVLIDDKLMLITLDYVLESYRACILMPVNGLTIDILMPYLKWDDISGLLQYYRELDKKTDLSLPKIDIPQTSHALNNAIKIAGLGSLLDTKSLQGIANGLAGEIQVTQETMLKVDESGTVAAMVTKEEGAGGPKLDWELPEVLTIDHPFILMIFHEDTKALLNMSLIKKL